MKRAARYLILMLAIVLIGGCEWESVDDAGSWDSSYWWVHFAGLYRALTGGVLVSGYTSTPGSNPSEAAATDEPISSGVVGQTTYDGTVANYPVVIGSLSIVAGGFEFSDNGDGTLTGNAGTSGTIVYDTGAWFIDLLANDLPDGESITASYEYTVGGTEGTDNPGNTGAAINTMLVEQQGNLLTFTDNNGARYTGRMGIVSTTSGDMTGGAILPEGEDSIQVVATFEVNGTSSAGVDVQIVGTFEGSYTPPDGTVGQTAGYISGRILQGTWIEATGVTGDIVGQTGPASISGGTNTVAAVTP